MSSMAIASMSTGSARNRTVPSVSPSSFSPYAMPEEPESLIVQYRSAAVSVASPDDSVIRSSEMVKATSSAADA